MLIGSASTAHAGGWAVVALDALAESPVEGHPISVGFTILQHGVTPYTTSKASIIVTDGTGRSEHFTATPDGEPGHHIARVTFPGAGVYRWEVQPDWFARQPLGEINVERVATVTTTPTAPTATTTTTSVREPFALALRILLAAAFAIALGAVMAEMVTARRRAPA